MANFRDDTVSGKRYLIIADEKHAHEHKIRLKIYKSLIGPFAAITPKLTNPLYKHEWTSKFEETKASSSWILHSTHHGVSRDVPLLTTLGRRIVEEGIKWGESIEFVGEFQYHPGYWEWNEDVLSRCEDPLRRARIYDSVYASLFTYDRNVEVIKAFCEAWCPSTNTLLTSHGEMCISLWYLHTLSGLPVDGTFFDDVVPCTKELVNVDSSKRPYLPSSCSYLFHAHHLLQMQHREVSIKSWIHFWSRKKQRYECPPSRTDQKKKARNKATHNPTGKLPPHKVWTAAEEVPFIKLTLRRKHWEETYLAAFIVCWLCTFVLPDYEVRLIRPETFKMASKMAVGEKVALTIPVLASIYRGLNILSMSSNLSSIRTALPFHFVYSWIACYFKTHSPSDRSKLIPKMVQFSGEGRARYYDVSDARKHIYRGQLATWTCIMPNSNEDILFVDDGGAAESRKFLFIAIRSSYLAMRQGDQFSIEPYSPHRFSRQFGYHQLSPGVLTKDLRKASLEDGLKYWRLCLLQESNSQAHFPGPLAHPKKLVALGYKNWWDLAYKNFLEVHAAILIPPKPNADPEIQEEEKDADHCLSKRKVIDALDDLTDDLDDNENHQQKRSKPSKTSDAVNSPSGSSCHQIDNALTEAMKDVFHSEPSKESSRNSASIGRDRTVEISQSTKSDVAERGSQTEIVSQPNVDDLLQSHCKVFVERLWSDLCSMIMKTPSDLLLSIRSDVFKGLQLMEQTSQGFDLSHLRRSVERMFANASAYENAQSTMSKFEGRSLQRKKEVEKRIHVAQVKEKEKADLVESLKKKLEEETAQHLSAQRAVQHHQEELANINDDFDEEAYKSLKSSLSLLEDAQKALENQHPFA